MSFWCYDWRKTNGWSLETKLAIETKRSRYKCGLKHSISNLESKSSGAHHQRYQAIAERQDLKPSHATSWLCDCSFLFICWMEISNNSISVQRVVIRIKSDYPMPMLNKCLLFLIKVHIKQYEIRQWVKRVNFEQIKIALLKVFLYIVANTSMEVINLKGWTGWM